jgi:hypothetical protein
MPSIDFAEVRARVSMHQVLRSSVSKPTSRAAIKSAAPVPSTAQARQQAGRFRRTSASTHSAASSAVPRATSSSCGSSSPSSHCTPRPKTCANASAPRFHRSNGGREGDAMRSARQIRVPLLWSGSVLTAYRCYAGVRLVRSAVARFTKCRRKPPKLIEHGLFNAMTGGSL